MLSNELYNLISQSRYVFPEFLNCINMRNGRFKHINLITSSSNKHKYVYVLFQRAGYVRVKYIDDFRIAVQKYFYQMFPKSRTNVIFNDIIKLVIENGYSEQIKEALCIERETLSNHLKTQYVLPRPATELKHKVSEKLVKLFKSQEHTDVPDLVGVSKIGARNIYRVVFSENRGKTVILIVRPEALEELFNIYQERYILNPWQENYVREQLSLASDFYTKKA